MSGRAWALWRRRRRDSVRVGESAAERDVCAEYRQEVGRDTHPLHLLRALTRDDQTVVACHQRADVLEGGVVGFEIEIVRRREWKVGEVARAQVAPHEHEAIGVGV